MESESIVDYLKSSLGKPWPLIANSSSNNNFNNNINNNDINNVNNSTSSLITTTPISIPTPAAVVEATKDIDCPITNGKVGNGLGGVFDTLSPASPISLSPTIATFTSPESPPKPPPPPAPSLRMPQLDGLYPEWDEFYLFVCDICGIIIRPQALEKHLATKHRISVQTNNHNHNHYQSLSINNHKTSTTTISTTPIANNHNIITTTTTNINNNSNNNNTNSSSYRNNNIDHSTYITPNKNSSAPTKNDNIAQPVNSLKSKTNSIQILHPPTPFPIQSQSNSSQTTTKITKTTPIVAATPSTTTNNVKPQQNGTATQQQIPPKLWGGKHALDSMPKPAIERRPCDWVKVRRVPDTNPETLGSFVTKASPVIEDNSPFGHRSPPPSTTSRYQDRKWRNTFNVLKDTFF